MISFDTDDIKYSNKTYGSIHNWLRKNFGSANHCENLQCKKINTNYCWAKVNGKEYDFIRENFIMLCGSCHYYYDRRQKIGSETSRQFQKEAKEKELIRQQNKKRFNEEDI